MTIMLNKPSVEKRRFDKFMNDFKSGKYGTQRLGQAFYNEMNLHKIYDQASLQNLYELDGEVAVNTIKKVFKFN